MRLFKSKEEKKQQKELKLKKQILKQTAKKHSKRLRELEKSSENYNKTLRNELKKSLAPNFSSQIILYDSMVEDGICEIEKGLYSKTLKFSDVNYQIARKDERVDIFTKYCELLNYCDPSMHLQISIVNRKHNAENFKRTMLIDEVQNEDLLNSYRREMNNMLLEKALQGQNSTIKDKYVTFTTSASNYSVAVQSLSRIEADIVSSFKQIGCDVQTQSGLNRLENIHNMISPYEAFGFSYDHLIESSLRTKSFIAPSSFDFSNKNYFKMGDLYSQVVFIKDLPAELNDKIIAELTDLQIDMCVTLHIENVEQINALEYVRKQIAYMELEATNRQDNAREKGRNTEIAIPLETRRSYDEAHKLLNMLENENQRMFKLTILISTIAKSKEELDDNIENIKAAARKNNVKVSNLDYLQREAFNSILPIGKNHIEIKRTLTTASTAVFVPFTTVELFQNGGMYYGLNARSHNMIFFNRYSLKAPNGLILGTPGSGKSFAAKREIINVLLNDKNAEVIIIDPEREYTSLADGFDGEVVNVSVGSKNCINPFDCSLDYGEDEDPLLLKSEFIITICDLLIGRNGLSGAVKSIISRACKLCYGKYFLNPQANPVPTLVDFYHTIKNQPEPEAQALALELEIYIDGTLSVFSSYTNVDTQKKFVIYDVRDLGKQLRTFGMIVVLDQIWNKITKNRTIGKRTWIYIDEIQLLFSNEYSANYFFELWSRARKWGAVPTGITQNVETLLLSDLARRMLSNSDFIMMLNQSKYDRDELASLLDISEMQLNYVTNSESGQGLLFAGKSIVPFVDKFPNDTKLYKMMTTKIEEIT